MNNSSKTDHASSPLGIFASKSVSIKTKNQIAYPSKSSLIREDLCYSKIVHDNNFNLTETVFSRFTFHFSLPKVAFTLAEVLITLGIIGVVAALTIPTLIEKHREQVTVNKVKKFYSTVSQAFLLARNENDSITNWVDSSEEYDKPKVAAIIAEKIIPHLKILKDCGFSSGCVPTKVYLLKGELWSSVYDTSNSYYKSILADGSVMWFRSSIGTSFCQDTDGGYNNVCGIILYDFNGTQEPNTIGRDIFIFVILQNSIMPERYNCNLTSAGWGCAEYILRTGKMDYLHK